MRQLAPIFALLLACAALAHAAAPVDCWALRKHGAAAEAQDCFESLTRSSDAYNRAEGFWGLEEWQQANCRIPSRHAACRQQCPLQSPLGNAASRTLQRF